MSGGVQPKSLQAFTAFVTLLLSTFFIHHVASTPDSRVPVTVYFEAKCSDSRNFIKRELREVKELLGDIMDLDFVPFGKARSYPWATPDLAHYRVTFECHFGEEECQANMFMSCGMAMLAAEDAHNLVFCMMNSPRPFDVRDTCFTQPSSFRKIEDCRTSVSGQMFLQMSGVRTARLSPRLDYVPTVIIGEGSSQQQYKPRRPFSSQRLLQKVCQAYGRPHPKCP